MKAARRQGGFFSHSLPLVTSIRLSMPPAGFGADCIIATRAVSGQPTAFFISESGELCHLYFSADFRIIFAICTCIEFFPCYRKKLHFFAKTDLHKARSMLLEKLHFSVIWTCYFSYCLCCENQVLFLLFFSFSRQHPLFEQQVQIPQNQRNKSIFIIAISFISYWLLTDFMALYAL